jgi:signal transduction histidine kinase
MHRFWSGSGSISFRKAIEGSIFLVTLVIIVFFSILIRQTTELVCNNDGARPFLERIKSVPLEPWKIPVISLLLFALLAVSSALRPRVRKVSVQVLLSLADLAWCVGIITVLDFSYRGILFIAIVNAVRFIPQIRLRTALVAVFVVTYMLADYSIVSMKFPVFSINDYMDYYRDSQRFLFYGIRNLLISLNEILFILFMVMEIQIWIEENVRTRDLNHRLLKTSEDLQLANVRLEEYARRSEQTAKIKERNRLAREIHDIVGHSLMGIDLGLKACLEVFTRDPARVRSQLEKISTLARSGVEDIRRSVHQLKVDPDEGTNFVGSLETLVAGIRECTGAAVTLAAFGTPYPLAPLAEEALYRAAQEGLTNAIRHGEAARVELEIHFRELSVDLTVRDDGKGCPAISEGFGLQHMRERCESLGGSALFRNLPLGFLVAISIPAEPGTPWLMPEAETSTPTRA